MYNLIDRQRMCVCYRHPDHRVLEALAHIELFHSSTVVITEHGLGIFSDLELKLLYENMCGQKFPGYNYVELAGVIANMLRSLPEFQGNAVEVFAQSDCIQFNDKKFYKYLPGSMTPALLDELFKPNALTSVAAFKGTPAYYRTLNAAPATHTQAASVLATQSTVTPSAPKPPREPHAPSDVSGPPKTGSKTGRIWALADEIFAKSNSRPIDFKAIRKELAERCEQENINSSTMSVQFGKWKSQKL